MPNPIKRLVSTRRVEPDDPIVQGLEVAFLFALFLGIGYLLDRWLGTSPILKITFVLIAGIGVFTRLKYAYDARMERHQAARSNPKVRP